MSKTAPGVCGQQKMQKDFKLVRAKGPPFNPAPKASAHPHPYKAQLMLVGLNAPCEDSWNRNGWRDDLRLFFFSATDNDLQYISD